MAQSPPPPPKNEKPQQEERHAGSEIDRMNNELSRGESTCSHATMAGYEGPGAGHGRHGAGHHPLEAMPKPIDHLVHKHGRLPFRQRVLRVTWGWFPCTMSTGAMASLLSQQPFTFDGLLTIGKIFYVLDVALFVLFTFLIIMRFSFKPRALTTSLHHPSESFFFGAFWVSVALILYGAQVYGVPAVGGAGSWLAHALRALFWVYIGCAALVAVFQYHVIFHVEKLMISDAMPAWILPAYPFLVTGVLAASIAKTQPESSSLQMIVAGIAGQGLGWMLALFIYMVFLTRLINSNMPAASTRPGMYVSVGPAGESFSLYFIYSKSYSPRTTFATARAFCSYIIYYCQPTPVQALYLWARGPSRLFRMTSSVLQLFLLEISGTACLLR